MRLFDRLAGRERLVGADYERAAGVLSWSFAAPDSEAILPTYDNCLESYANSAVVFGLIGTRMRLFSQAEFKWQNLTDKSLFGNPDLGILENPWPGATASELLARMEQDVSLAGNAYVRRAGDRLERLRPDKVTIVSQIMPDGNGGEIREVVGYAFDPGHTDEDRKPDFYPVDEVVHWSPEPDPTANYRGMSWLTAVLREIDADQELTDYKRSYLENAATPNMLIKYAQKLGPDRVKGIAQAVRERHGGVDNAFKTLVLDEGADVTVLGNSLKDMAFDAVQAAGENRIAVASQVPAIIAGLKEGLASATYSNYEQAMRRFADLWARPQWESVCAALSKLVNVPAGARLWFDVTGVAALRQGEKERADTMAVNASAASTLIQAGYEAASVTAAITSGDMSLLKHTGLVSVQMQAPGTGTSPNGGTA